MFEIMIHSHALKHGISKEDILHAWKNYLSMQRRRSPREEQTILVGYTRKGELVELVGIDKPYGTLIYHAYAPPTKSTLRELGLIRGD